MNYSKYKSQVYRHLGLYREHLSSNKGIYRGKDNYDHILAKNEEKLNLIGLRLRSEFDNPEFLKLKYHSMFNHLNSSQALTINLFFPLLNPCKPEATLDKQGFIHGADFSNLSKILGIDLSKDAKAKFEYTDEDQTNYDFFIQDGCQKITFEVKYTEGTICTKSSSKNDDIRWEKYYRDGMISLLGDEKFAKEIFFCQYQLWRNIVNITRGDSNIVCFVFSEKRTDLEAEVELARKLINPDFSERIRSIHIEDIYKIGLGYNSEHYKEFNEKYLNI